MGYTSARFARLGLALVTLLSLGGCATSATGGASPAGQTSANPTSPLVSVSASPSAAATSVTPSPTPSVPAKPDCSELKCIAITYDDGPSALTDQLIDDYVAAGAKATFFVNGNFVRTFPETVKRAHQLGFEVGNHTTNHKHLPKLDDATIAKEMSSTTKNIEWATGATPTLMRPPYGERSARVDAVAEQQGLAVISWTSSPADWANKDTATIVRLSLERARPGAILLMHDTHQWTVDAAPATIKGLQDQGYTLVTVIELIGEPVPGKLYPTT